MRTKCRAQSTASVGAIHHIILPKQGRNSGCTYFGASVTQRFEWDEIKAAANARKHGVPFEEAASVLSDPLAYTFDDPDHSVGEQRLLTFGFSQLGRVLAVVHVERGRAIRIISARRATRHERGIYEQS